MKLLRKHWYDLGGILSILVLVFVYKNLKTLSNYELLMYLSLVSLFYHQLEEYRIVGTFPGMMNKVMFKSKIPDRYPLNTNTALIINVVVGWLFYFLAAYFGEKTIWLGIAVIMISSGNFIVHTFVFNIKGKTFYNAGMITSWLFLAPCVYFFFYIIYSDNLITTKDYLIGIPIGIVLNVIGVLKLIDWLKDKNTPYIFEERNLLPKDRKIRGF
jgi:hypothetical protein